ncbi:formylglycine-generating enzyme family protein [Hwanghaeella sp.]|uniref:formylglycine-generating enzyme family protein n=1 Tax=Hwanghaeella sp. TaxID=2605943 RepID=UPI003CCB76BF
MARRSRRFSLFPAALLLCLGFSGADARAAEPFRDCELCPEMVPLTPEPFVMGYDNGKAAERPARMVTLPGPFAIARTETTYAQWMMCVADGGCTPPRHTRGWDQPDRPVIYVDYHQVQAYLAWLSEKTGRAYRLPTEEEWEFAAHGGANGPDRERVDGMGRANCNECTPDWHHETFPVASLPPNGYGLYDMLGNVMEWTSSCWTADYQSDRESDCTRRTRRGGSWYFNRYVSTPTYRYGGLMDRVSYDVGFRVAADLPD